MCVSGELEILKVNVLKYTRGHAKLLSLYSLFSEGKLSYNYTKILTWLL